MSLDPDEPRPAPRLIIPGADPEPSERPRIIPGTEPEPAERPRIILPPGAVRDSAEELPEYPRLRRLMILPVRDGERELLLVQDPMGIIRGQPVLGIESLAILQLLDGTVSLTDISAAVMSESKDLRVGNMVRDFIAQLDEMLMLESPRFERALAEAREGYHRLEIRPAALEGVSYPAARDELEPFLDEHFRAAESLRAGRNEPAAASDATPRAILAPHLDPRREGVLMARAFMELGTMPPASQAAREPLRFVIFGTGHNLTGELFALTRKHFETPLGKATCDTAFVDRVAERLGESAYRGELAHRDEHSIEFQLLYLQHRLKARPFTIVPILAGGFYHLLDEGRSPREDEQLEALIAAIREAEAALGGTTIYVAGVDFSHVGPRFGDGRVTDEVKAAVREVDDAAIAAAAAADADAWFRAIAERDDATRICGFAPTYAMLRCAAPGRGRELGYAQSSEKDTSVVSVAAMAWS
jgi:AmmeMemoRadiSam system protein B